MQMLILPLKRFVGIAALGLTIAVAGCGTMEKASDLAKAALIGGEPVDVKTLSDRLVGNTTIDVDGKWHSYMRDDGVVLMWTESDGVKQGSWRRDADGILCQTMGGEEVCIGDASVSQKDGVYMMKAADGNEMNYRIVSGNSKGL